MNNRRKLGLYVDSTCRKETTISIKRLSNRGYAENEKKQRNTGECTWF